MKIRSILAIMLPAVVAVGFSSCKDSCQTEMIYDANVPVYLSYEELRKPITSQATAALEHPGKFWRKDAYVFVSDVNKGVHVYNISNPSSPSEAVFINIPGVKEVAVKGNYLLADSYSDLLVIDISSPSNPTETKRLNDVFPYNPFYVEANVGFPVVAPDQTKGVVVGWEIKQVKDEYACSGGGPTVFATTADVAFTGTLNTSAGSGGPVTYSGGGSTATFAVMGDFLYSVTSTSLSAFTISDPTNPSKTSEQQIGWGIETIVAYERYLFLGTQSGVRIYGINTPASPSYISMFTHATACDPVIVQDDIAYVTLRDGTPCQGFNNQLDILNVENIASPYLIKTYPMTHPYGLGIDGNILVVCEEEHGTKVFNAADVNNIQAISTITAINARDVIMHNGLALFIGTNGIWVYTYDSNGNFQGGGVISIVG